MQEQSIFHGKCHARKVVGTPKMEAYFKLVPLPSLGESRKQKTSNFNITKAHPFPSHTLNHHPIPGEGGLGWWRVRQPLALLSSSTPTHLGQGGVGQCGERKKPLHTFQSAPLARKAFNQETHETHIYRFCTYFLQQNPSF